ncbi:MAG: pantetheine-phosphate adenylyltransferase [Alphaproteobacteria bacterium]|nr:MAG: pantetheine-phosphate adenylyltransferase [Alphaproteobacteria bacterium]
MKIGLYPGTFDPLTNGHLDIIVRSSTLCDKLIIAVAKNPSKNPFFSINKRIDLINEALLLNKIDTKLVYAEYFDNLLIDFAKINSVSIIIRGLRVVSDFDYEFQMAGMNKRLNSDIETIFLMASETNQFIASRFVKEVASLGGDVSSFVPKNVNNEIIKKFSLIK